MGLYNRLLQRCELNRHTTEAAAGALQNITAGDRRVSELTSPIPGPVLCNGAHGWEPHPRSSWSVGERIPKSKTYNKTYVQPEEQGRGGSVNLGSDILSTSVTWSCPEFAD